MACCGLCQISGHTPARLPSCLVDIERGERGVLLSSSFSQRPPHPPLHLTTQAGLAAGAGASSWWRQTRMSFAGRRCSKVRRLAFAGRPTPRSPLGSVGGLEAGSWKPPHFSSGAPRVPQDRADHALGLPHTHRGRGGHGRGGLPGAARGDRVPVLHEDGHLQVSTKGKQQAGERTPRRKCSPPPERGAWAKKRRPLAAWFPTKCGPGILNALSTGWRAPGAAWAAVSPPQFPRRGEANLCGRGPSEGPLGTPLVLTTLRSQHPPTTTSGTPPSASSTTRRT